MKTTCLALLMIGCTALIHGTSYASSPKPAMQEQSPESSTKRPGSDHPTDTASAENGQRTRRRISDKKQSQSRVSPTKVNRPRQLRQLRNGRERSRPESGMNVHQTSTSKPVAGATRIANHPTVPVHREGAAALNGTQFRDSRNRGAAPAIIGGTASATKGTAAINGTRINRRHVN